MKTKMFTLFILFSSFLAVSAAEYIPLVNEDNLWSYYIYEKENQFPIGHEYYKRYKFDGDTIINTKNYKKLYEVSCSLENINYVAAIREEEEKVYCVQEPNNPYFRCGRSAFYEEGKEEEENLPKEFIIYDFSLNKGDEYYNELEGRTETIRDVQVVNLGGLMRKRIELEQDTWIEGIGSINYALSLPIMPGIPTCEEGGYIIERLNYQKNKNIITYKTDQNYLNLYECNHYTSLLNENALWSYCDVQKELEDRYDIIYWQYQFKGDTIINETSYKKLYKLKCGEEPMYNSAMRDENDMIYVIYEGETKEKLIYDFNLEVGQTMTVDGDEFTVNKVDYVEIGRKLRKRINDDWIEGIGSIRNFTAPLAQIATYDLGVYMNYYKLNNQVLYKTDEFYYKADECNDYIPVINSDLKWSYYYVEGYFDELLGYCENYYYSQLQFKGDTIINDITYSKMYQTNCNSLKSGYVGAMRESDKKVYCVYPYATEEAVIYDFNLKQGDTFNSTGGTNFKVTKTDYVIINGKIHKRILLNYPDNPDPLNSFDTWIEGIGSTRNIFYMPLIPEIADGGIYYINYLKESNIMRYRTYEDYFNEDECNGTAIKNVNQDKYSTISENPVKSGKLLIRLTANVYTKIELVNMQGQVMYEQNINEETEIGLNTQKYPSGIYFLRLTSKENSVSEKIIIP